MSLSRRAVWVGVPGCLIVLAWTLVSGCGRYPQVSVDNREIIISLATAISAQNSTWLEQNARLIESRKAEGKLSGAEFATFSAIIAQARAGQWKAATDAVYALRDAQAPTADDRQNVAQRKLDDHHGLQLEIPKRGVRTR